LEEFAPKRILQNADPTIGYRVSFGVKGVRTIGFAPMPPLPLVLATPTHQTLLNAPLPCHREHRWTAAIAPVSALCQIEQMPWGPERPVKCRQVSQELKRSPWSTPSANTQREEQGRA